MTTKLNWKVENCFRKKFENDSSIDPFLKERIASSLQAMYDLGHADGYAESILDEDTY